MASEWPSSPRAKRLKTGSPLTPDSEIKNYEGISCADGSSFESSNEAWYVPSSESSHDALDSGYSDGATPPASYEREEGNTRISEEVEDNSNGLDEDSAVVENEDDDDDDVLSDITDLSESDWNCSLDNGPFSWVQREMVKGTDPRELLQGMVKDPIPDHLDPFTLWKILLNVLSEPPRREKLSAVNTLKDVIHLIQNSRKILVLTGAGVSVSCGIPDFRSRDGVYARLAVDFPDLPDPQAMFDIHYFRKDPRPFFKFAREIYPGQFQPSPCHRFIQCLEKHGKLLRNYTQNIDTLEQVAGIKRIVQCHGSFATASCTKCKNKVSSDEIKDDILNQRIPLCSNCNDSDVIFPWDINESSTEPTAALPPPMPGIMKPDIVFFGEDLGVEFHNSVANDKDEADLLIMIGSSLKVRPVALIPSSVPSTIPQILINREVLSHLTPDVELLGDCDGIINQICHHLEWEEPKHGEILTETTKLEENSSEASWTNGDKTSLSHRVPAGHFYFQPPSRYIFPGAEVYSLESEYDEVEETSNNNEASTSDGSTESLPTDDKIKNEVNTEKELHSE